MARGCPALSWLPTTLVRVADRDKIPDEDCTLLTNTNLRKLACLLVLQTGLNRPGNFLLPKLPVPSLGHTMTFVRALAPGMRPALHPACRASKRSGTQFMADQPPVPND